MKTREMITRVAAGAAGAVLLVGVAGAAFADDVDYGSDEVDVNVQIDPAARVQGPVRFGSVAQLRRKLRVVLYRQADQPATLVQVEGLGP